MEPLAIVGMACRFAQEGDTNENFWKLLMSGRSAMTPFPKDRINMDGHYHPDPEHGGSFHVQGGHFMTGDPADFDNQFFSIPQGEVLSLDPQQRLSLESVYHALENAGITLAKATGSNTSVFSSGFNHDWLQLVNSDPEIKLKYKPMGTSNSIISGRISWFFDFKGPSITVDTACSSSMVAFHLGAQSLRHGESDMTVISGVNVFTYPTDWFSMDHHGFLSGDAKSYSFDSRANGYSRGEGVATLILKRLSTALQDGDVIRAVVRANGLNQDGRTAGITLPSAIAQERMIRDVYTKGNLDINETAYIESHGTGTAAGDPIEARAISDSFKTVERASPLIIGAVKSVIGHTEGASGIAGIIKTVMILESGIITPNTNFEKVNPKIPIDKWNLTIPVKPIVWPSTGKRQASVNSFGFSGTNGHVVLQDAYSYLETYNLTGRHKTLKIPRLTNTDMFNRIAEGVDDQNHEASDGLENGNAGDPMNEFKNGNTPNNEDLHSLFIFAFSSFDEPGIGRNVQALADYYSQRQVSINQQDDELRNLAYTLAEKRTPFSWRSYCLANSLQDLIKKISTNQQISKPMRTRGAPNIGFVFTGQGAQWYAMGRELLAFRVFKRSLLEASEYMQSLGSTWSLYDELLQDEASSKIDSPSLAHPACTAIQIAIVDLLLSWNLLPTRVVGHSSGEIAAAYSAQKINRTTAWRVAFYRGFVSNKVSAPGAMLAVGLAASDLAIYMEKINSQSSGELTVACYNSPKNHTVSGDEAKIDALKSVLDQQGIFARKLKVKTAYHSAHMKTVADEYLHLIGVMEKPLESTSHVEMYSSVTGAYVDGELTAEYWIDNLISPVRFTNALQRMSTDGSKGLLKVNLSNNKLQEIVEIGPHSALRSAIKETLANDSQSIGYHAVLNRTTPGVETILNSIGALYSLGSVVSLERVNQASDSSVGREPVLLTSLPHYVFNHSQKIWNESRLSRNFRLRKYPRHDLFGAPVPDWNPTEPAWRNFIRISEQPWLRDHVITGSIVYPGVGYIIMAIEASKQIADSEAILAGFHLKDISIKSALIIPDNKHGIEVKFAMSAMDESSLENSKTWRQWRLTSYNPVADNWVEHCTGYISTTYEVAAGPVDGGLEKEQRAIASQKLLHGGFDRCTASTTINYETLDTIGFHFGPTFQNITDLRANKGQGEVAATITVPDVAKIMPKNFTHPHIIHPSTMDSMMHLFIATVIDIRGKGTLGTPMVPTFIKEVRISAKMDSTPGHKYKGLGASKMTGFHKFDSDITIWDYETDQEKVAVRGWCTTSLGKDNLGIETKKLCHSVRWQPDLQLVKAPQFSEAILASVEDNENYRANIQRLQLATVLFVTLALEELQDYPVEQYEGHFRKYYEWCLKQRDDLHSGLLPHVEVGEWKRYFEDKKLREELFTYIADFNEDGKLLVRMGMNIANVLRREVDPLHLMFGEDNLLNDLYKSMVESGNLPVLLNSYLEIVHHNSVNLNILEIGAGTGSLTEPVLKALSAPTAGDDNLTSNSVIIRYTYTDISSAFFEKAKEKFRRWRNVLEFRTFNIENDASVQGFEEASYDYIFAGNVVHATADLKKVISNLKLLLKLGGKLVLHESIRQDFLWPALSFGQLKGWWLSVEENRRWGPTMSERDWDVVLRESGLDGVGTGLRDRQVADIHGQSIMISTNIAAAKTQDENRQIYIISSGATQELAVTLQTGIGNMGLKDCYIVNLTELTDKELTDDTCISLIDLEHPVLAHLTEEDYKSVNHILATSYEVLWLSGDFERHPEQNLIAGVVRTVRWERDLDAPNLVMLAVTEPRPSNGSLVESILSVFKLQFIDDIDTDSKNAEYLLRGNEILTSRLIDADNINSFVHSHFTDAAPEMTALGKAGRPLMLDTSSPGSLSALHWVTDPAWSSPLGDDEVEIEIHAVGLNFRDVLIAMGEYVTTCLGNEAAGYVSRIGPCVSNVKVGDRVVYMNGLEDGGCFKTFGRQSADVVVKLPNSVSFEDAASLPSIYSTAIHGLYDVAHLAEGESVLIHAAAGGVGQAAIQLAKLVGAEIFATVSTPKKRDLLIQEYGIKKDHIFSSRDLSFVDGILRMTNNRGIDVVLNSLSGEALRSSWDLLAPFGRFIEIGKKDAQANGRIELHPLLRQTSMASVDLKTLLQYKPKKVGQLIRESLKLLEEGKIRIASPTRVLDYTQIEEGFRSLQSGKTMGKIVFKSNASDIVPIMPYSTPPLQLEENATYILAGGLGGLGRSIARWMASRGAKNLVFLSRSGGATETAQELIQELEASNCRAYAFVCDVSDREALSAIIGQCKDNLPPIKGCVQGSMVLRDAMFENMSYINFNAALKPKFDGSWNLHSLLPTDMDFFLLLSSATGILGNRSQANYAAGNTYQDALALYRHSKGLPATSIDLGSILSVGYVAENYKRLKTTPAISSVLEAIREDEIHLLIEYHLDLRNKAPYQTVTGLPTAAAYKKRRMPIPGYLSMPLFKHLRSESNAATEDVNDDSVLMAPMQLIAAASIEEAVGITSHNIRLKLSKLLSVAADDIDLGKSISSNGVDSLVATEFRSWLAKTLKADVPMLEIMGTSSILTFSEKVAGVSSLVQVK